MKEIKTSELMCNPFDIVGKDWMLINAKTKDEFNSMTANWGGFGHLWNKDVAFIFIRPQRYTKRLADDNDVKLSLSFFDGKYKKELAYLGSVSTYEDKDKMNKCGLNIIDIDGVKTFKEASLTIELKELYRQTIKEECFIDKDVDTSQYPEHDYHDVYVCEVLRVFKSEQDD